MGTPVAPQDEAESGVRGESDCADMDVTSSWRGVETIGCNTEGVGDTKSKYSLTLYTKRLLHCPTMSSVFLETKW